MVIDMHIHTSFSPCSVINIPDLVERAYESGLDGICITDHDTTASKNIFGERLEHRGLCIIVGMEYTTSRGDFLIFGPAEYVPEGMEAEDLIGWARKEGGVAIPAHPFRQSRPTDPGLLPSFGVVEVLNGRNRPYENERCRNWLSQYGNGTRQTGGSDAHTLEEVGQVVTVFEKCIYGVESLISELRGGSYKPSHRSSFQQPLHHQ